MGVFYNEKAVKHVLMRISFRCSGIENVEMHFEAASRFFSAS